MTASDGPAKARAVVTSKTCAGAPSLGVLMICIPGPAGMASVPSAAPAPRMAAMTPVAVTAGAAR